MTLDRLFADIDRFMDKVADLVGKPKFSTAVRSAAQAVRRHIGEQSWLTTLGVSRINGEECVVVYVNGRVPNGAVPGIWDGFAVLVREAGRARTR
jgi:GGDEF domain-containing protein